MTMVAKLLARAGWADLARMLASQRVYGPHGSRENVLFARLDASDRSRMAAEEAWGLCSARLREAEAELARLRAAPNPDSSDEQTRLTSALSLLIHDALMAGINLQSRHPGVGSFKHEALAPIIDSLIRVHGSFIERKLRK